MVLELQSKTIIRRLKMTYIDLFASVVTDERQLERTTKLPTFHGVASFVDMNFNVNSFREIRKRFHIDNYNVDVFHCSTNGDELTVESENFKYEDHVKTDPVNGKTLTFLMIAPGAREYFGLYVQSRLIEMPTVIDDETTLKLDDMYHRVFSLNTLRN